MHFRLKATISCTAAIRQRLRIVLRFVTLCPLNYWLGFNYFPSTVKASTQIISHLFAGNISLKFIILHMQSKHFNPAAVSNGQTDLVGSFELALSLSHPGLNQPHSLGGMWVFIHTADKLYRLVNLIFTRLILQVVIAFTYIHNCRTISLDTTRKHVETVTTLQTTVLLAHKCSSAFSILHYGHQLKLRIH